MVLGAVSFEHCSVHGDVLIQVSEQSPAHLMLHLAPSLQTTLLPAPTVSAQLVSPEQSALHPWPQAPLHLLLSSQ